MAGWIKTPLGREVGLGQSDIALDGDPAPLPKKGTEPPKFLANVYCGQTAGWIKMPLGMKEGLVMLDGDPPPLPQKGHSAKFSVHVYCGQTARWIKMPLGMKVGLGPGHIVSDRDPAPP